MTYWQELNFVKLELFNVTLTVFMVGFFAAPLQQKEKLAT